MPKILCQLPNASESINGVRFVQVPKGMLSEEVSDETAAYFAAIAGYTLVLPPRAARVSDQPAKVKEL